MFNRRKLVLLVLISFLVLASVGLMLAAKSRSQRGDRPKTTVATVVKTPSARAASPSASAATTAPTNRLKIPAIGVDAPMISVGLTANGNLDAPSNLYQVGVYSGAPWPGLSGAAVVDGHSGAPGQNGVLENLSRLKPGDPLVVVTASGTKTNFVVKTSRAYPDTTATAEVLFAKTAAPTMNLISCYGNWDAKTRLYDQRWIVTAALAP